MQKQAIYTLQEKVLVVAGAGTGKTTVLTERIMYLLRLGVNERNIFAFTFTNKAANEMKERIKTKLNKDIDLNIFTFHSYFYSILRLFPEYAGFEKGIQVLDEDDKKQIIKQIIKQHNIKMNDKDLITYISKIKNHVEYEPLSAQDQLYLNKTFIEYQETLKRYNKLDFDDILYYFKELLDTSSFIREELQNECKYILVDECQDTNKIQYEIIKILSQKHQNIYMVGDPDQLIYTFRGSNIDNINDFILNEKATVIKLEENYRSTTSILSAANSVINKNTNRVDKTLYTNNKVKDIQVIYRNLNNNYDEAQYLRLLIQKLINQGYQYKDMAILYRNNYLSPPIEKELIQSKIPFIIYGGYPFFKHKEIKTLISYYRFIHNPNDDISFDYIINKPYTRLSPAELIELSNQHKTQNKSKFEILRRQSTRTDIISFFEMLQYMYNQLDPKDFIEHLVTNLNYEYYLNRESNSKDKINNLNEFKRMISEIQVENSIQESTQKFMDEIILSLNQEDKENDVKLMTIHQSKGLEFKIVFLIGLNEGIIPPFKVTNKTLEEERRLFYVAITRAKERLFLMSSKQRNINNQTRYYEPTRFIHEIEKQFIKII